MYLTEHFSEPENEELNVKNLAFEKIPNCHDRLIDTQKDLTERDWTKLKRQYPIPNNKAGYWLYTPEIILAFKSLWPERFKEFGFCSSTMWQVLQRMIKFNAKVYFDYNLNLNTDSTSIPPPLLRGSFPESRFINMLEYCMCFNQLFNNNPPTLKDKIAHMITPSNKYLEFMIKNLKFLVIQQLTYYIENQAWERYLDVLTVAKVLFPNTSFPCLPQRLSRIIKEDLKKYRSDSFRFIQLTALLKLHAIEEFSNPTFDENTLEFMKAGLNEQRQDFNFKALFVLAFYLNILDAAETKISQAGIQLFGLRSTAIQLPARFPFMSKLKVFANSP